MLAKRDVRFYNKDMKFLLFIFGVIWMNVLSNRTNYEFSEAAYQKAFINVVQSVTRNVALKKNHAVLFLGAQPGAGKSTFCNMDNNFTDYIIINGDNYRIHHPYYREIVMQDKERMAELTQSFVNRVVEDLIRELSKEGYNLIIEGTLRDPQVPIRTGNMLKEQGYTTELYVIGCNACISWESTISRAKLMEEVGQSPRLVPIEKYDKIVNNLVESLKKIEASHCMDRITIISRDSKILWKENDEKRAGTASVALDKVLDVAEWNSRYQEFKIQYDEFVNKVQQENVRIAVCRKKGGR